MTAKERPTVSNARNKVTLGEPVALERDTWNACRLPTDEHRGHYESYFLRANHPTDPKAFWIRYTLFVPTNPNQPSLAEVWAIYFEGSSSVSLKQEFPLADAHFARSGLQVDIATCTLDDTSLRGSLLAKDAQISWDLLYEGDDAPILLFPRSLYALPLPKAKSLVARPNVVFQGKLKVNGELIPIDGWIGSQNHNWGEKHTDRYAWGQVATFDDAPHSFLEIATARLKIGPLWSPWLTVLVLKLGDQTWAFNSVQQALRAKAHYRYFEWNFESTQEGHRIRGRIQSAANRVVALPYRNPPGDIRTCLNSKLARCDLELTTRQGKRYTLQAAERAAFEILTDHQTHKRPTLRLIEGRGALTTGRFQS